MHTIQQQQNGPHSVKNGMLLCTLSLTHILVAIVTCFCIVRCRISCVVLCSHSTCYSFIYCIYYQKPTAQLQVPWFPRRIQDLERACKTVFNYGEEFTPDHPVSSVQV